MRRKSYNTRIVKMSPLICTDDEEADAGILNFFFARVRFIAAS